MLDPLLGKVTRDVQTELSQAARDEDRALRWQHAKGRSQDDLSDVAGLRHVAERCFRLADAEGAQG